ncbi:MAG: glycosyl hydrolase family 18 protein [bacterium]|nr:glycosyl hydrolase family 18 protein [bacterium]
MNTIIKQKSFMNSQNSFLRILVFFVFVLIPAGTNALTTSPKVEVSGWIPYWRTATGTADAMQHLDVFTEINPFVYTVKLDGTLYDAGKMGEEPWLSLQKAAQAKKIRYIPTVMWSNAEAMHRILSKQKTRIALEDEITALVKEKGFDGIDIDFEGKKAETKTYFSTFLKGLYQRMGKKWVMCTIESRTPIADRYFGVTPPKDAGIYSNDFVAINKYCDRVRIMAYDQQGIDLALADKHKSELYAPVADTEWVEKTMKFIAKTISKKKLVIGVPTYGYEYDVTAYADGYVYDLLWSFNPGYALPIAKAYGLSPVRSSTGELNFSYTPTSTIASLPPPEASTTPVMISADETSASGLPPSEASTTPMTALTLGNEAAKFALYIASSTNTHLTFRSMWWSDAEAIKRKIELAKKLGVRGIAIFKIDGGEDPGIWNVLK